jgi:hypothetical protein
MHGLAELHKRIGGDAITDRRKATGARQHGRGCAPVMDRARWSRSGAALPDSRKSITIDA